MSKRARPFLKNPKSDKRHLYKDVGHGSYKKKRRPLSKWIRNGAIK